MDDVLTRFKSLTAYNPGDDVEDNVGDDSLTEKDVKPDSTEQKELIQNLYHCAALGFPTPIKLMILSFGKGLGLYKHQIERDRGSVIGRVSGSVCGSERSPTIAGEEGGGYGRALGEAGP